MARFLAQIQGECAVIRISRPARYARGFNYLLFGASARGNANDFEWRLSLTVGAQHLNASFKGLHLALGSLRLEFSRTVFLRLSLM